MTRVARVGMAAQMATATEADSVAGDTAGATEPIALF
jgi:hypothetical protein